MDNEPLDLRSDLHGHAVDYACSLDRAWFEAHPGATHYERPQVEHEWCCPTCAAEGRCTPGAGLVVSVKVILLGEGLRARQPLSLFRAGGEPAVTRCAHMDAVPVASDRWAQMIREAGEEGPARR